MEKFVILNTFALLLIISLEKTSVTSCPTTCKCRGKASKCNSGFTAYPGGLDSVTEYLSISGSASQRNSISTLSQANFQSTTSLFTLIITFSGVQTVQNEAFSALQNLHDLSLADNEIKSITGDTFKGLSKLRTLDISGNTNCKIDKSVFTHISGLEELNLGNMNLQNIDKDLFSTLTQLKILKLYINGIKKIHQDVFAPLTNLQTLDLNGNQLLGLPVELKPMLQNLKNVHISENPWQCNCQLLWLRELQTSFVSSLTDTSDIICNGPKTLKYQSFVNVPEKDFVCIPPKVVQCDQTKYSLDVNHKLTINCQYEGDPIPEVKFIRPDGVEIDGRKTVSGKYAINENGTLTISSVALEDNGDWTVSAYNVTAHGDLKVNVHVIVTTTSTSTTSTSTTTSTTTTTTTTTTPSTVATKSTKSHAASLKSTSKPLSSALTKKPGVATQPGLNPNQQQTGNAKTTVNIDLLGPIGSIDNPQTKKPETSTKAVGEGGGGDVSGDTNTVVKENPINYGLMAASAAGGGTIVGIICIILMCCKKKQNNEKNKVSPFEDDFDL